MNELKKGYLFLKQQESNMRILLIVNILCTLVLPIVEVFMGAYIMRNTSDPVVVAFYQLVMYIGIITTSLINGYLLKKYNIKISCSIGILVGGISILGMMTIKSLGLVELGLTGFLIEAAFGFSWTNRYLLALYNTNGNGRNYFSGLESFFFSITSIGISLITGTFISQIDGKEVSGSLFNINTSYCAVVMAAAIIAVIAHMALWKGKFEDPKETNFLCFRSNMPWKKMLWLAGLKGMVQGFLVIAPTILVLKLVGGEGALGSIQGVNEALTAVLAYILGHMARPQDRLKISVGGLIVLFVGALSNGILFFTTGMVLSALCKMIFQPLFDLTYLPIMIRTIDAVAKIENRNEYTYILSHEFGLFLGRVFDLLLFIFLAYYVSKDFVLKYALVTVAGSQLAAYPLARNITNRTDTIEYENDK